MKKAFKYRIEEKKREMLIEMLMVFFISTTCICILEGILGMIFMPETVLSFGAFFSPPLFGVISVILGMISNVHSDHEMSVREVLLREILHLVLIECAVFGLNRMNHVVFSTALTITLLISIALIYVIVYIVLLLNDRRSAMLFNEQLKKFQQECSEE